MPADAVPADVLAPEVSPRQGRVGLAKGDHLLEKTEHVGVFVQPAPVQPGRFVVLVVGIVVPALRLQELVAHAEHGHAGRQHQQGKEIAHLPAPQLSHGRRDVAVAFPAAVPAEFVVTVLVVLAVRPVLLVAVRHQVVQREAVMRSDVIDALIRAQGVQPVVGKQIAAAVQPSHQLAHHPGIALGESLQGIAVGPVPLHPAETGEHPAQLERAGRIPRLRDQPYVRQVGIRRDLPEQGRVFRVDRAVRVPRENARQIEAEAVDVQVLGPIPQAVQD